MLTLVNAQPVEKVLLKGAPLEVHSVWSSLQGEGPDAGTPAVFVRLYGCTLQCRSCDTDYTSARVKMEAPELVRKVYEARRGVENLVVITGGEPFRQHLEELIRRLRNVGYKTQVETNGACGPDYLYDLMPVSVVCSPKVQRVREELLPYVECYKYVLDHAHVDPHDGLPTEVLGMRNPARPHAGFKGTVFVQPMDAKDESENEKNRAAAVRSCVRHGYRLSLQTHKMLGLE